MWPQTLQMSEDECRSALRRLELETYASVIGAFRAQGGLSDKKAKLLEEMRNVFHISQDRHRAEARRVSNDEHLSTIAKVVSGPNTWQEWSREGRRPYPMLPRVAPQTALGWIANNLAAEAARENAKLPYPAETAAAAMEGEAAVLAANAAVEASGFHYSEKYVVTSDPFKMPNIPAAGVKKNLKRGMNDAQQTSGSSHSKKRNTNDLSALNKQKHASSVTAGGATTNSRLNKLQQQRFFYQQQQKAKKLAKAASKREKLSSGNKSGRKSKKLKEQLNQQLIQEEQLLHHEFSERSYENQMMQQLGHQLDPSTNNVSMIADAAQQQHFQHHHTQHIEGVIDQKDTQQTSSSQKSYYLPLMIPQIAASKRDITRNLTKLQIPGQVAGNHRITAQQLEAVSNQAISSPTAASSQFIIGNKTVNDGKLAPLSTPVQKYIVEDRQPPASGVHQSPSVASSCPPPTQQTSTSQYMSLPHLSTPNKLRAINTAILPSGTKLSTSAKKLGGATILSATVLSPGSTSNLQSTENIGNSNTTSQLYSLVDGGGGGGGGCGGSGTSSNSSQQQILSTPSGPTHTPPAVIQLHSNETVRVGGTHPTTAATSTQSKVLTTKILPLVLSGNTSSTSFTKGDAPKNGNATIVSSSNFVTNSGTAGSTIIKSLSPSIFVSGQHSGFTSSSPVFSSFGSAGPVYRKHPNILKSSSSMLSRNSLASSGGPQIISNIRLTPAITTATTTNSNFGMQQTQSGIFQQPLRTVAGTGTTGIRTSVKICQSPNGKVFIQPANVDTSKLTKLPSGHISQRILPGTLLGTSTNLGSNNATSGASGSLSSNQPGSPHRIAIQKVQIIPAPLSGNMLGSTTQISNQQHQQRLGTTSLTIGAGSSVAGSKSSFSGNIFVPTAGSLRSTKSSAAITLTKATFSNTVSATQNDLLSGNNLITKQHSDIVAKSSNLVVIDATSAANKILPHHTKLSNLPSTSNISRANLDNSQMITEDTPVDIIVDNSENIAGESSPVTETSSITAVLASNVIDNSQQSQNQHLAATSATSSSPQKQSTPITSSPTMVPITVLNATDWEMELDQATAASITNNQQNVESSSAQFNQKLQQQQTHIEQTETAETIIIDDSFEDVIIEEEEHEEIIMDNDEHYEEGEQDMEIEASDSSEIIMVDNLGNLDDRTSQDEPREGNETINTKKSIMLNENDFKSISSEDEYKIDVSTDVSIGVSSEHGTDDVSTINDGSISESVDSDQELEPTAVSEAQSLTEATIVYSQKIYCNNHEDNAETIKRADHTTMDSKLNDSGNQENIVESVLIGKTYVKEETKNESTKTTTVSASLFSVKDIQDSTEVVSSKAEVDQEASATFDVNKEAHSSSSKNDGLHATDH